MTTPRIHQSEVGPAGGHQRLDGSAASHVSKVLRLGVGDALVVFDGKGTGRRAVIAEVTRNAVCVELGARIEPLPESPLAVTLLQAIGRGNRMDFVVQKATELGVSRIVPVMSHRSVVRLDTDRKARRQAHWNQVAASACEQCGRDLVPQIDAPVTLTVTLSDTRLPKTRIVLAEDQRTELGKITPGDNAVAVLVGPEGGFTQDEYALCADAGFEPTGLGPRTLRTETAPLAAIAILQFLYGDLSASG